MFTRNIRALAGTSRYELVPRKEMLWSASVRYKHAKNHGHGDGKTSLPEHAPEWDESLATNSEAYIKADQSFEKPSVEHTIETLRKVEEKARYREDGVSLSATYERDSIEGPLKDKGEQGKKGPEHHEEIKVNIDIDEVEGPLGANKGHKTGSEEAVKADRGEAHKPAA